MELTPSFWSYMVRLILTVSRDRGVDNTAMSRRMLLLSQHIEKRQVSIEEFAAEFEELLTNSQEHDIIWTLQPHMQGTQVGPAFVSLFAAANLKICLQDLLRLKALFFSEDSKFTVKLSDKLVKCSFSKATPVTVNQGNMFDAVVVFFFHLARTIAGQKFDVSRLTLPSSRQHVSLESIRQLTQGDIDFSGDDYCIAFDKSWLTRESFFHNEALRDALRKDIERELLLTKKQKSFSQQVMSVIRQSDQPAGVTLAQICDQLGVSDSTARRKLKDEGSSFSGLQKWWLYQQAVSQLVSTEKKVDVIAMELGYSERTAFERAFKAQMGITAAKFREFGHRLNVQDGRQTFEALLAELPPMPDSCQKLIQHNEASLDVPTTVNILNDDPLFAGRVMGLASRAIYGSTPKDLHDAVGHKLGVQTVKNIAFVYGAKDLLSMHVHGLEIEKLIQAILISPTIYRSLLAQTNLEGEVNLQSDDHVLTFGLLGMFLLFHHDCQHSKVIAKVFSQSSGLLDFHVQLDEQLKLGIYSTSSLLLSAWGMSESLIKTLVGMQQSMSKPIAAKNHMLINLTHALALAEVFGQSNCRYELEDLADKADIEDFDAVLTMVKRTAQL